ncbi:MAG: hypothetical protein BZ135_08005 [Methanosphaera sp. rholeuAM6]|nr:MAG: hypothetical protein BZ135_08005 [Methanosphaera sp. rholeuAM6]
MKDKLLIYELDCFNSIFSVDRKILKKVFSNIIIPRIAYDELKSRMDDEIILTIKSLKRSKFVILEDFEISTPEHKLYRKLKDGIECKCRGKCESAAIIIAKENDLTILSNHNGDYVQEYNIQRISMVDMLSTAYNKQLIDIDEAELLWSNMRLYTKIVTKKSFVQYYNDMET